MNRLRAQVRDYLRLRRALGYKLVEHERFLNQYLDYLEQTGATTITQENALTWACLPVDTTPRWHAARLGAVRGFACWAHTIDPTVQVPPTGQLSLRPTRSTPYLYSDQEIDALMHAAGALVPGFRASTYQTAIGLLTVTGMRPGEVVRLNLDDLDLDDALLTVRNTKFGKSRLLPLHPSTIEALRGYLRQRATRTATTPALLISVAGTRLTYDVVFRTFRKLCSRNGLEPRSSACRPRLHDLRHTFAVNTLIDAYRTGTDPNERLPLLSTYLGHAEPANTYWYLHASPELLTLAAERLSSHREGTLS
nr:tyrosine-type recombinase/integrase [Rhodococcus wratislaviensis]GLK33160.1 putative integrase/recombinase y4rB [Rhodococcus wratislaviensis]